jgi:hypothetical protein
VPVKQSRGVTAEVFTPVHAPCRVVAGPPWARLLAHVVVLTPLPSSVWRLMLVLGLPAGVTAQGLETLAPRGWGAAYVVALCVLSEVAALATLGLVHPWGRILPRWIPLIGARRVPRRLTLTIASCGVVMTTVLWTLFLVWWLVPHPDLTATGTVVVGFLYLPLVAWAPLLALLTISFARRTRPRSTSVPASGDG